eukprot:403339912
MTSNNEQNDFQEKFLSLSSKQEMERELWTCSTMDCDACIKFTGRQYCSNNGISGTCCTTTDDREPCITSSRNCSNQFGTYNAVTINKNYPNFLVCPYVTSDCGTNPSPQTTTDKEYDARFGDNYFIARSSPTAMSLGTSIQANKTCVYVIRKDLGKQSLALNITFTAGADIAIHRGTRLFTGTFTNSYTPTAKTDYQFDTFGDSEYIYLIVKAKVAGASVQFQTFSFKDKEVIVTPVTSDYSSISVSVNWPLIVGVVVGGLGFIALVGFLIFYFIRRNRQRQQQQLVDESNGVKNIRQKNATNKKDYKQQKNKNGQQEEEDEYYDEEDDAGEESKLTKNNQIPVKPKKMEMPVHPDGGKYAGGQNGPAYNTPMNPGQFPPMNMTPEQMQMMMQQFQQMQQQMSMMPGGMNMAMPMMGSIPQMNQPQPMFPTVNDNKAPAVAGLKDIPLTETGGIAQFQQSMVSNNLMNTTSKSGKKSKKGKGKKGKGKKGLGDTSGFHSIAEEDDIGGN